MTQGAPALLLRSLPQAEHHHFRFVVLILPPLASTGDLIVRASISPTLQRQLRGRLPSASLGRDSRQASVIFERRSADFPARLGLPILASILEGPHAVIEHAGDLTGLK